MREGIFAGAIIIMAAITNVSAVDAAKKDDRMTSLVTCGLTNGVSFQPAQTNEYISYEGLWHILDERAMTADDLRRMAGISIRSIARLQANDFVRTNVLHKISVSLNCHECVFSGGEDA